jgi:predicted Holliday junction resolvase-like endonuclease
MEILSSIKLIIGTLITVVFVYLSLDVMLLKHKLKSEESAYQTLESLTDQQNNAITVLKKDAINKDLRISVAEKKAQTALAQTVTNSNQFINDKVSTNCLDAINWGIEQAKVLNP